MKLMICLLTLAAFTWWSLWLTPDQYGQRLMERGEFTAAAVAFEDPFRQGVAWFRAGEFEKAEQAFARVADADSEFNRGNALVMQGKYKEAVERYDRVLQLEPGREDASVNREIAAERAKLLERKGGDMGDQKRGADEIRYDKDSKSEGQDTEVTEDAPMSSSAIQSLWLRRIQTKPADFLKSKFAYQLAADAEKGGEE